MTNGFYAFITYHFWLKKEQEHGCANLGLSNHALVNGYKFKFDDN